MVVINPIHITGKSSNNVRYNSIQNNVSRIQHEINEQFRICDRDKEIVDRKAKRNATLILKTLKARNKQSNQIPFSSSKRTAGNEGVNQALQNQYFDPSDVDILASESDIKRKRNKDDTHYYSMSISQRFPNAKFDFEEFESFHQIINNLDPNSPFYEEFVTLLSAEDVRSELELEAKRMYYNAPQQKEITDFSDSENSMDSHQSGDTEDFSDSETEGNEEIHLDHQIYTPQQELISSIGIHKRNSIQLSSTPISSSPPIHGTPPPYGMPPRTPRDGKRSRIDDLPSLNLNIIENKRESSPGLRNESPRNKLITAGSNSSIGFSSMDGFGGTHQDLDTPPLPLNRHDSSRSFRNSSRSTHRQSSARSHRNQSSRRRSLGSSTHVMNLNATEDVDIINDMLVKEKLSERDSLGFSDSEDNESYVVDELEMFAHQDHDPEDLSTDFHKFEKTDDISMMGQQQPNDSQLQARHKSSFSAWDPFPNSVIRGKEVHQDFTKKKKIAQKKKKTKPNRKKITKEQEQASERDKARLNLLSLASGIDTEVDLDFQ